jgi:hypothetical protein
VLCKARAENKPAPNDLTSLKGSFNEESSLYSFVGPCGVQLRGSRPASRIRKKASQASSSSPPSSCDETSQQKEENVSIKT